MGWTLSHSTSGPRDTHIANEGTDALVTRKRHCALTDAERIDGDYNGSLVLVVNNPMGRRWRGSWQRGLLLARLL